MHYNPDDATLLRQVFADGVRPDPVQSVSQWADEKRFLSGKASAEPGKWRTKRFPPLKEIMDCMSVYEDVQEVAVMKGAQVGVTEVALNTIGYAVDYSPGPLMYCMPDVPTAEKISETRLTPMIESTPALKAKIGDQKSRDAKNTKTYKDFPGGFVTLVGAHSPAGLRSLPIRWLIGDEQDAYPLSAGKEGDPYELAKVRCRNFPRSKILTLSTPNETAISRILQAFLLGDQRYYEVPCTACGACHPIKWQSIQWDKGQPETACYVCPDCNHKHYEHEKRVLLEKGEWVPTAESQRPGYRSYHLSALYSPWLSWVDVARDWLACHRPDGTVNNEKRKVFINTVLGEPWEDTGEKVESDKLLAAREPFGAVLNDRIAILTAGVDVQEDRLEVELVGWGVDEESWSVDYRAFYGDPDQPEVWKQLDDYLQQRWPSAAFPESGMPVTAACVDTGGSRTQAAYKFVGPRHGRKIWGIKGSNVFGAPVWPRRPKTKNKGKVPLYSIGVSSAKDVVMKRLDLAGHTGAGACHFPKGRDLEYFEQITAEEKRVKYVRGQRQFYWHALRKRNEALDCRVYAYSALQGCISLGLRLNKRCVSMSERAAVTRAQKAKINMCGLSGEDLNGQEERGAHV
ncbi:phage terminase large subunit (GpA) [Roseibium sp. TrichSKD4]|uniref:phage terminase large subunit family protein n=1 Tax=Roseibium sp. TrichSKD4 TaxID=744980 RepID=UPI0001E56F57|nr:phage terminase large subunit family protein [Roseibium sp. TrichSKD4]EFO31346.1 phage terminase large subunit (GpA) [Roseibium sp. TrichSKD4]